MIASTRGGNWLKWAREIQALSQTGLAYSDNEYHAQRYRRLMAMAAEILHSHTGVPEDEVLTDFMFQRGYATPKIDVRGAVIRDGRILLVQERSDGRWCMPGGWADVGEVPSEMVVREVREESGFHVTPLKVIGVYDANREGSPVEFYHAYKIVFGCKFTGGEARPSDETAAVGFFRSDDLPPLSTNRTDIRHVAEAFDHLRDRHRPTAFD